VAVIDVALTTATLVAAVPPIDTVAPDVKPVPVIVTPSPPVVAPAPGATADTVGAAAAGGDGWEEGPAGLEPPHEGPNTVSIATAIYTHPDRL
jgi:hypothetical protein